MFNEKKAKVEPVDSNCVQISVPLNSVCKREIPFYLVGQQWLVDYRFLQQDLSLTITPYGNARILSNIQYTIDCSDGEVFSGKTKEGISTIIRIDESKKKSQPQKIRLNVHLSKIDEGEYGDREESEEDEEDEEDEENEENEEDEEKSEKTSEEKIKESKKGSEEKSERSGSAEQVGESEESDSGERKESGRRNVEREEIEEKEDESEGEGKKTKVTSKEKGKLQEKETRRARLKEKEKHQEEEDNTKGGEKGKIKGKGNGDRIGKGKTKKNDTLEEKMKARGEGEGKEKTKKNEKLDKEKEEDKKVKEKQKGKEGKRDKEEEEKRKEKEEEKRKKEEEEKEEGKRKRTEKKGKQKQEEKNQVKQGGTGKNTAKVRFDPNVLEKDGKKGKGKLPIDEDLLIGMSSMDINKGSRVDSKGKGRAQTNDDEQGEEINEGETSVEYDENMTNSDDIPDEAGTQLELSDLQYIISALNIPYKNAKNLEDDAKCVQLIKEYIRKNRPVEIGVHSLPTLNEELKRLHDDVLVDQKSSKEGSSSKRSNNSHIGNTCEAGFRQWLNDYIKPYQLFALSGQIIFDEGASSQLDCIVIENKYKRTRDNGNVNYPQTRVVAVIELKKTLDSTEFSKKENDKQVRKIRQAAHLLRELCKNNEEENIPYLVFGFNHKTKDWFNCLKWHTYPNFLPFETQLRSDTVEAICVFNKGVVLRGGTKETDEPLPIVKYFSKYTSYKRPEGEFSASDQEKSPCLVKTSWIKLEHPLAPIALLFSVLLGLDTLLSDALQL